jgi:hypothetical protein
LTRFSSSVTESFNTALRSQSILLSLLSLQQSTINLPFPLIAAGRVLVKRGALHMVVHTFSYVLLLAHIILRSTGVMRYLSSYSSLITCYGLRPPHLWETGAGQPYRQTPKKNRGRLLALAREAEAMPPSIQRTNMCQNH